MAKNIPVELPSYHPRTERPGDREGFGPKKNLSVISKILLFVKYGCFLTFYQGSPQTKDVPLSLLLAMCIFTAIAASCKKIWGIINFLVKY